MDIPLPIILGLTLCLAINANAALTTSGIILNGGVPGGAGSVLADALQLSDAAITGNGTIHVTSDATLGNGTGYINQRLNERRSLMLDRQHGLPRFPDRRGNRFRRHQHRRIHQQGDVRGTSVTGNYISANGSGQVFNNTGSYVQKS